MSPQTSNSLSGKQPSQVSVQDLGLLRSSAILSDACIPVCISRMDDVNMLSPKS